MFATTSHQTSGKTWIVVLALVLLSLSAVPQNVLAQDARCPGMGGDLTVETIGGELSCIHTFTDEGSDTFEVPVGNLIVELLVVGGGGAGGQAAGGGGGGGAGGLLYNPSLSVTGSVPVTVGAGGSGSGTGGQNGQDSSFGSQVGLGGGGGSPDDNLAGLDGGSGGGGSGGDSKIAIDTAGTALQLPEFGHDGGVGRLDKDVKKHAGGGGGGASADGSKGDAKRNGGIGGAGGDGLCAGGAVLPQWMDVVGNGCFAGGGGGTSHETSTENNRAGSGGLGGGGDGEEPSVGSVNVAASPGVANSGGGGGAARNGSPGAGGSGVVMVRYAAASQLVIEAGNNQTGIVNEALIVGPSVRVTDDAGNPMGSVAVSFAVASGGGIIDPTTPVLTNASGIAALNTWTLGTTAGEQTLTATVTGLTGSPQTFTANANPGAPTRLGMKRQPSAFVSNGEIFAVQPEIQLLDTWGNVVTEAGINVTATIESGGGVLGGTTTIVTNGLGIAQFEDLFVTGLVGPRILQFDAPETSTISSNTFTLQAGDAVGLVMTQEPSSLAQSGVLLAEQPKVGLVDQSGNRVSEAGVSVAVSLVLGDPSAVLGGTLSALTDASGVASFTDLLITGPVDDYGLGFASAGLTGVSSDLIAVSAGPPTTLAIIQQPSAEARSGFVFAQQPIIQLQDSVGNPALISGVGVSVVMGSGDGVLGGTTTALSDAQGRAVFTDLLIDGQVGTKTLRFTASGYSSVTSSEINLVCGRCEKLAMITQPVDASAGQVLPVSPVVGQFDAVGNPTTTPRVITVSLAFGPGTLSGTTTKTSSGGQATFDDLVIEGTTGPYALTFSSDPLAATQSDVFELQAGVPSVLSLESGNNQSAVVGNAVATAPSARVVDAWDNPVSGVSVDFAVTGGGGSVSPASVVTNASGIATVSSWTLGTVAGANTLQATSASLSGQTITWSATAIAGAPTQLNVVTGDGQTAAAGTAVPVAPTVEVLDAFNNPVSGVTVEFAVTSGGGSVIGASSQTNAQGRADVGQWVLGTTPGANALSVTAEGVSAPALTFSATGVVGPAAQLVIAQQPVAAGSGQALAVQPIVQITDQFGNLTSSTETIEASLTFEGQDGIPGTLSGTLEVAAIDGVATFSDLVLTGTVAVGYQIEFSNDTLSTITSEAMSLLPGLPAALEISQQPSAFANSGVVWPTQPTLRVVDQSGNAVPEANIAITVALASGTGTLSGPLTLLTDTSGKVAFSNLSLAGVIGARTLIFTATGLTSVESNTITLLAGEASHLHVVREPSRQVQSGALLTEQPWVQVVDDQDNAVARAGVRVSVSLTHLDAASTSNTASKQGQAQSTATLSGTLVVESDASGLASFTDLVITGEVGTYQLVFASEGLIGVTGDSITLNAGPPQKLQITRQPSASSREDFVFNRQPVVALLDSAGNPAPVAGVAIEARIGIGGPALEGTTTVLTDAQGVATFTDLKVNGVVGIRTLRFVSEEYGSVTSDPIEIICGRCAKLAMDVQPIDAISGEVLPVSPVVGQYDNAGNRTSTPRVITVQLVAGPGTLTGTTTKISSDGQVVFDDLVIEGASGDYVLAFSSPNLAGVSSNVFSVKVVEITYDIQATVIPAMAGEVVCDPNPVPEGGTSRCVATATPGFDFLQWDVCPGQAMGPVCELTQVSQDDEVIARFGPAPLPVPAQSPWALWWLLMAVWMVGLQLIPRR